VILQKHQIDCKRGTEGAEFQLLGLACLT